MDYTKVSDTPAADEALYSIAPLTDGEKSEMEDMRVTDNGLKDGDPPEQPTTEDIAALLQKLEGGGAGE